MAAFLCPLCDDSFSEIKSLQRHINCDHGVKQRTTLEKKLFCKANYCKKEYTRIESFLSHIQNEHSKTDFPEISVNNESDTTSTTNLNWTPISLPYGSIVSCSIANLRFSTTVTGTDLGKTADEFQNSFSAVSDETINKIDSFFKYKGYDTCSSEYKSFLQQFEFHDSFSKYKDMRGQIQSLKNNYKFIEPREFVLGKTFKRKYKLDCGQVNEVEKCMQYVPLQETLKLVLSNDEVLNYIKNSDNKSTDDDIISSYEDGSNCKNNPFLKKYPTALRIRFYMDDFLSSNPLSSKATNQKITAFCIFLF